MFRCSFSILDPWSKGNYDEALRRYWRVEIQPTQAMIDGKLLHERWQSETQATGCLPKVFGGTKLVKPETERKMDCVIDDWIQFVGVIDLIDENEIYEYKTGRAGASAYASSWQFRCYQLLGELNGYKPHTAHVLFYNQHIQKVERGKIYLQNSKPAEEWIRTFASEMKSAIDETERIK